MSTKLRPGVVLDIKIKNNWHKAEIVEIKPLVFILDLYTAIKKKRIEIQRKPNWINLLFKKEIKI